MKDYQTFLQFCLFHQCKQFLEQLFRDHNHIFEAVFESLIGTSIAVGLGWGIIEYSKNSIVAESIFDVTISDSYLIYLTLVLVLSSILFGLFASFVGIRKVLND